MKYEVVWNTVMYPKLFQHTERRFRTKFFAARFARYMNQVCDPRITYHVRRI